MIDTLHSDARSFHPTFILRTFHSAFHRPLHPAFIFRRHNPPDAHNPTALQATLAGTPADSKTLNPTDTEPSTCLLHGEFITTVDVWQLDQLKWPIMRALTPGYVDHLELDGYLKRLLTTGQWREVYAVPHAVPRADPPRRFKHVFDVYGERA